jgi:hypothetical protein
MLGRAWRAGSKRGQAWSPLCCCFNVKLGGSSCPGRWPTPQLLPKAGEEFSVELDGRTWTQKPQKYHAKSLRALRDKYAAVPDKGALDSVLERADVSSA